MRRLPTFSFLLPLSLLVAACASVFPSPEESGQIQVRGRQSAVWPGSDAEQAPNVVISYETTAWRDGNAAPFHRMRTELRVSYDPETGKVLNARIDSAEPGNAFRHVCLAPAGPVLHVRMATLLDGRDEDLTVLKLDDDESDQQECRRVGVGPNDGLVESFDVLFRKDGTYRILPDTKVYLAGADLRVERKIREGLGETARTETARYP